MRTPLLILVFFLGFIGFSKSMEDMEFVSLVDIGDARSASSYHYMSLVENDHTNELDEDPNRAELNHAPHVVVEIPGLNLLSNLEPIPHVEWHQIPEVVLMVMANLQEPELYAMRRTHPLFRDLLQGFEPFATSFRERMSHVCTLRLESSPSNYFFSVCAIHRKLEDGYDGPDVAQYRSKLTEGLKTMVRLQYALGKQDRQHLEELAAHYHVPTALTWKKRWRAWKTGYLYWNPYVSKTEVLLRMIPYGIWGLSAWTLYSINLPVRVGEYCQSVYFTPPSVYDVMPAMGPNLSWLKPISSAATEAQRFCMAFLPQFIPVSLYSIFECSKCCHPEGEELETLKSVQDGLVHEVLVKDRRNTQCWGRFFSGKAMKRRAIIAIIGANAAIFYFMNYFVETTYAIPYGKISVREYNNIYFSYQDQFNTSEGLQSDPTCCQVSWSPHERWGWKENVCDNVIYPGQWGNVTIAPVVRADAQRMTPYSQMILSQLPITYVLVYFLLVILGIF